MRASSALLALGLVGSALLAGCVGKNNPCNFGEFGCPGTDPRVSAATGCRQVECYQIDAPPTRRVLVFEDAVVPETLHARVGEVVRWTLVASELGRAQTLRFDNFSLDFSNPFLLVDGDDYAKRGRLVPSAPNLTAMAVREGALPYEVERSGARATLVVHAADAREIPEPVPAVALRGPVARSPRAALETNLTGYAASPLGGPVRVRATLDDGPPVEMPVREHAWSVDWNDLGATRGRHVLRVVATDAEGRTGGVERAIDLPGRSAEVRVESPAPFANVTGVVAFEGTATDADGDAVSLTVWIDEGQAEAVEVRDGRWRWELDTRALSEGQHAFHAFAADGVEPASHWAQPFTVER